MDTSQIKGPEFWSDRKRKLVEFGSIMIDSSASSNPDRHRNWLTYYAYRARDYIKGWGQRLNGNDRFRSLYTTTEPIPTPKDGDQRPQ